MRKFVVLSTALFSLSVAPVAFAGEYDDSIYHCGTPVDNTLTTDNSTPVCDFYTRQLEYRIKANDLRDRILSRQKNFQGPSKEARRRYEEKLIELNKQRGIIKDEEENAETAENKS